MVVSPRLATTASRLVGGCPLVASKKIYIKNHVREIRVHRKTLAIEYSLPSIVVLSAFTECFFFFW